MMICCIKGCEKPVASKNTSVCHMHYTRWRRHGDPLCVRPMAPRGSHPKWLFDVLKIDSDECIFWPFPWHPNARPSARIDGRYQVCSRWICKQVHGAPPTPKHEAAHSCGNGHLGCLNPKLLRWATRTENQIERCKHGRANFRKHSEQIAYEIKKRLADNEKQISISRSLNVPYSLVNAIANEYSWAWLKLRNDGA